ncbi:SRPBCC family protein [Halanaeroarchaeum sulfurireducens]|uniref:Cyclase/dehydrase n=1 Tax=Halanaeroarchaeum sulfurireducens TaxID=1604004 RepID=A0A0F7P8P9_9EURY|nr:SRPBCC family protein [Halanaeroarchaeum sulfurireducens]AKH96600.1 cyclase/dehydrase [Halanaeroarchaeum sulfurireducens]ALG81002.1 cyclase/dehydrase [Halanaeroarchaeum sulfurireducens]
MPTYYRSTVVDAPLDDVWAFHADVDGLRALTPSWSGLEIESVTGPDGERDPETLEVGTDIEMRVRPLGLLPGPAWTSRITRRERTEGEAVFRDTMIGGPLETWEHAHRFRALDGRTLISDRLDFALPPAYEGATPAVRAGLAALFAYRHHRTRTLLADQGRVSATVSAK